MDTPDSTCLLFFPKISRRFRSAEIVSDRFLFDAIGEIKTGKAGGVDTKPKKSIIVVVTMLGELLFYAIASLGIAFIIGGWGLLSKNPEDKATSKKYVLYIFLGAFALSLYGSDIWKSDLWK